MVHGEKQIGRFARNGKSSLLAEMIIRRAPGAEAPFMLMLDGTAEAVPFHGCAGFAGGAKGQGRRTGVSAPHGQMLFVLAFPFPTLAAMNAAKVGHRRDFFCAREKQIPRFARNDKSLL
jgi:hypothetical protein